MLGLCGGVGMRAFFFDGDTSFDLEGDEGGGVEGRPIVHGSFFWFSVGGGL